MHWHIQLTEAEPSMLSAGGGSPCSGTSTRALEPESGLDASPKYLKSGITWGTSINVSTVTLFQGGRSQVIPPWHELLAFHNVSIVVGTRHV